MSWHSTLSIGFLLLWVYVPVFANGPQPILKLGKIKFPNSGSKEVQSHFLRGVAALHSFWYEEALKSFRHAKELDPDFIIGYWGEAMAINHVLWEDQDTKAAQEVLAQIKDITKATPREQAYLHAVKLLYGKGDKLSRDRAYAKAMEKIYRDYPEDLEAACFYALSLLGVARNSADKHHLQIKAGEIGVEVFRKNPDHPCGAHYTIHAFDRPDLAIRALPAARHYAQIAPDSHHAQHMPSHIFLQLGMWHEAASANEIAWKNSVALVKREHLSKERRDYHSLQWLHYIYLQEGRYKKANQMLLIKLKDIKEAGENSHLSDPKTNILVGKYLERMIGAAVIEAENWEWIETFQEPSRWKPKNYAMAVLNFVRGFAAAIQGKTEASRHLANLKSIREHGISQNYFKRLEQLKIWELEIQGALRASKGSFYEAIAFLQKATTIEEKLPTPSGPPRIIKPTYELLGEILLSMGKPKEAAQQFATSLSRHPNRARSILGAARASANQGNKKEARRKYLQFLTIWKHADQNLPELYESRNYLEQK